MPINSRFASMCSIENSDIQVYTDGSCDTQHGVGAWVAIILFNGQQQVLSGIEKNTTHNRMELSAVIEALQFIYSKKQQLTTIKIFSDSQYVIELPKRRPRIEAADFRSSKGTFIQNHLLVKAFYNTLDFGNIQFEKVMAHQKRNEIVNYNIDADILARRLVRETMKKLA